MTDVSSEKAIRQRLKDDFVHYASKCLRIRTKSGSIETFALNKAQLYIHEQLEKQKGETGKVRALILKGRQQGVSTLIGGRFYHKVSHHFGMQAFILTHALDATQNLYKMAQRYYENTPAPVKPQVTTSNSKELIFGVLDSGYKLGTAENKAVGRSSTIQLLHASEVAFWNNAAEHAKGIMQAVPSAPGTEIIMESTANGVGNFFHQQWQQAEAGQSDYIAIFVPWFWQTEYTREVEDDFSVTAEEQDLINQYGLTLGQIAWRRLKITEFSVNGMDGKKAFLQEYPCTSVDAFQTTGEDTYISSDIVMRARKAEAEKYGKLVIGVDPARFGDDRTAIIRRQGRVAFGLETYIKKDTMEVVGIVNTIIQNENPFKVFVDVGGLGAGVVDRLKELCHRDIIVAVNAGSTALDSRKYYNKRAEMWGLYKQWLLDEPCQIPDNNELHADSCGIRYKIDSNSRLVMEQKADMKKRGIRSSDTSDALCFEAGTLIHTPTGKKPIEQLSIGDEVLTPLGKTRICKTWVSETSLLTTVKFSNGSQLRGKGEHKIFTWNNGVCRMDALELTFDVEVYSKIGKLKWLLLKPLLTKAKNSEFRPLVDIINQTTGMHMSDFYIVACGQKLMGIYQKIITFIMSMEIGGTIIFRTLSAFQHPIIIANTCLNDSKIQNTESGIKRILKKLSPRRLSGIHHQMELNGISDTQNKHGWIDSRINLTVPFAAMNSNHFLSTRDSVLNHADKKDVTLNKKQFLRYALGAIKSFWLTSIVKSRAAPSCVQTENVPMMKVYNLTLEKHNAYYANDILVYNCLTFAYPNSALQDTRSSDILAATIMQGNKNQMKARSLYYGGQQNS